MIPTFEGQDLSALAQLVAIHMANGTTSTAELARIIGYSDRAIRKAKAELGCRNQSAERNYSAGTIVPNPEPECRQTRNHSAGPKERVSPHTPLPKENYPNNLEQPSSPSHGTRERCVADAPHWKQVSDACIEAIGDAKDPLAVGLLSVAEPLSWISQGADLDLDVLPAIRALAARQVQRGGTISGWNYFAKAVAANKANRSAGLPAAEAPKPKTRMGRYGPIRIVEAAA